MTHIQVLKFWRFIRSISIMCIIAAILVDNKMVMHWSMVAWVVTIVFAYGSIEDIAFATMKEFDRRSNDPIGNSEISGSDITKAGP